MPTSFRHDGQRLGRVVPLGMSESEREGVVRV